MKKLKYSGTGIQETINSLRKNKIPFELLQTTYTMKIKYMGREREFIQGGKLNGHELNFIKTVKEHINKNFDCVPNVYRPEYYRFSKKPEFGELFYEIDLSGAYWNMSKQLGYISEPLYNLPQKINEEKGKIVINKAARLVALGALAKKTFSVIFDGEENRYFQTEPLKTEGIFFHIAQEVGLIMATIADIIEGDFLFFWVDAIFCKKESLERVKDLMQFFGFDYKVKVCEYSTKKNNCIYIKKTGENKLIQYPLTRKKLLYA